MAIYQGDTKISGNAMMVALPMFFATYQPRKLNNPSWLRAEPYSWHSADLYVSAYAHLADNISGVTAETETIAGTTITFYKLSDEIKVVLPDQETNLDTIYNATGIGYYFVLDTTHRQFKLPRNIYGFTGYRGDVGGYVAESLPNITGGFGGQRDVGLAPYGAFYKTAGESSNGANAGASSPIIKFDASLSSSTYQDNAPVQERATQAYLYFYVGNTVQNETSVDVGEITEEINEINSRPYVVESYVNGDSGYIIYSPDANGNKRCIQWGTQTGGGYYGITTINLLKPIKTPYVVQANINWSENPGWYTGTFSPAGNGVTDVTAQPTLKTSTSFAIQAFSQHSWRIDGYLLN